MRHLHFTNINLLNSASFKDTHLTIMAASFPSRKAGSQSLVPRPQVQLQVFLKDFQKQQSSITLSISTTSNQQ
jgi:hypothetical protein